MVPTRGFSKQGVISAQDIAAHEADIFAPDQRLSPFDLSPIQPA